MPEIKPANGETIDTTFGKTTAGSFSPYASDGQQQITLQIVDTEFSILDSLFYPWMKDINSPWWYRPDKVYTEWAAPYPMATLEVQRPRMRYISDSPIPQETRKYTEYTYYSYKFIGVKPTSYSSFEVNGGGVNNLLRTLNLSCDLCLVDLTGDVAGSGAGSTNLGNRTGFIFSQSPNTGDGEQPDDEENPDERTDQEEQEDLLEQREAMMQLRQDIEDMHAEIEQQEEGDMPGEDEEEWMERDDPDYNEDEYEDPFGIDDIDDVLGDMDEEALWEDMEKYTEGEGGEDPFDYADWDDVPEPWEDDGMDYGEDYDMGDPNGDLADYTMEMEAQMADEYGEPDFTGEIQDEMMDVGSDVADASAGEQGWLADAIQSAAGAAESILDTAVGCAVDVA